MDIDTVHVGKATCIGFQLQSDLETVFDDIPPED